MLRVIESFSGIGSQAKALKNIGVDHEIVATMDWDINAIIAYDIIHHGKPELSQYTKLSKQELMDSLKGYSLSINGKSPINPNQLKRLSKIELEHLLGAINRSKNLTSIVNVKGEDLPNNVDLFTYSFPCQDLSVAGAWHGNNSGINRDANNRSGMLWEVERILLERFNSNRDLPKFLLMENVKNIIAKTHKDNFDEWKDILSKMGYINIVYTLNAKKFGIPQKRERVYMLSIKCDNDIDKIKKISQFINENDLQNDFHLQKLDIKYKTIEDIMRIDYENDIYKMEANNSQPNDTPSRLKIYQENDLIYDEFEFIDIVSTITTKQDRNPNSGVVKYNNGIEGKSKFRYLTPRECFMLMGFDEFDYQILMDNNFKVASNRTFFNYSKLYKFAGNSIVVNVLEYIFKQIDEINNLFFS